MPVTLTDVAKAAGVSVATASRAMSGSSHPMNEETRQRILQLAEELSYQPNLVARSLRTDRSQTIGLIVENILSPFIPPIIRGIQDTLKPEGYFSTIINSDYDPEIEIEAIHALNNRQIDGIIFVEPAHPSEDAFSQIARKPLVFVHRLFVSRSDNSVAPDEHAGARLAAGHLLRLGHRRVAYINGPADWSASINRLAGYQAELAERGIPFDETLVQEGDWGVRCGFSAAQRLMNLPDPPTAIFAGNDLMALGAIYGLQEMGRRVPQDVAVMGYDNREITGYVRPAISTVTMPCYEMGQASARMLLGLLKGEAERYPPVEVQGKLIVRESCGADPGKWQFEEEEAFQFYRSNRRNMFTSECE